jgi:predicted acyl esterase
MKNSFGRIGLAIAFTCAVSIGALRAQQGTPLTQEQKDQRVQTEKELESVAIIERKVMIPMRDGVRLATDIYRPKNASGPVPIIWVRTPYNFNYWDVRNGLPADMRAALTAVKRGYAYVVQN